ncbi:MAG TPA: type I secretion C-terminal target domain-containing protein [Acetobacteraceae bacterium]
MANAISAAAFIGTLGINTHIDFDADGYQNLTNVENDINYLGVKIIRDSDENPTDAQTWLAVAQATGAKFDDYIPETSVAGMQTDLAYIQTLAQEGILAEIEGGDEEDDSYPASLGNTVQATAQFQQQLYALGQQLHLPVINMSFGAGWTAANDWEGDYGTVGNLAASANYANAHTYPNAGQLPGASIAQLNTLAQMAATQPVMTTEIGWSTSVFSEAAIAKYVLDATMDGIMDGDTGMYFYGLFDDGSGDWGLFNADGTPRPAATALHDLTTLLTDTGTNAATFAPGSLNYTLSGTIGGDNSVLIEKSDGSFWLSLWNETESANAPHTITVNLGEQAATVIEYDPLTGTSSIETWSNVSSVQVSVPDHPVLLEIIGGSTTTTTTTTSSASSSTSSSSSSTTTTSTTTTTAASSNDLALTLPGMQTVTAGHTTSIGGVAVDDAWGATNPGTMAVNLWDDDGDGTISVSGHAAAASMQISGTLAQINAELATLTFIAGSNAGTDGITVDAWNQAGVEKTQSIAVTINPAPTGPQIAMPASETVTDGSTTAISGVSIIDAFAASNPGTMAVYLSDENGDGTISVPGQAAASLLTVTGTLAQINTELAGLKFIAGSKAGSDGITLNAWDQAGIEKIQTIAVTVNLAPPQIAMPASESVTVGTTTAFSGLSVTDPFAAGNPGTLGLDLNTINGTIGIKSAVGTSVTGLGTHAVAIVGTLAQLDADLANLTYTAAASSGSDTLTVNVWDQAGLHSDASVGVTVAARQTVNIPASTADSTIAVSNANIHATSGSHMIFIGGTGDVVSAVGGVETVQAFQGGNTITTGTSNDEISIAGSGNVVNAGGGWNTINDSGSGNTIVIPQAGQGTDAIYGYVLQDNDTLDMRSLLAATQWNGNAATLSDFVQVSAPDGADAVISVDPSGKAGGASYHVATLYGAGPVSVATVLSHSLT